jgi:hypothetical protein
MSFETEKKKIPQKPIDSITFDFNGFYDEKIFTSFVKSVEKLIRSDRSYLNYVDKIKDTEDNLSKDVVLNNLKSVDATIELHHHPLTLYDIVSIVALHNFNNDIKFTSFSLAKEVLALHYANMIGLAPMCTTTHQLAHTQIENKSKARYISLTKKQIFGRYNDFVEMYKDGLTLETRQKITDFEEISNDETFKIDQKNLFK